ncbi:hypothetical protein ACFV20_20285 [Streptomyces sp. NPDC059696]|uniref:hypothetical protein n=1 Tax=Streptomyces sp. NPDC059696 TaxID=3346911 RepID=UPI00369471C4
MTSFFVAHAAHAAHSAPVQLAERWQGPPWFKWAFLGVWALCGVFVLFKLRQNGWKFPRRR